MTVTLKEFAGGAAATTLSAGIANNVLALAVADGSTFPTGSTAPFVIVIGRGTASEEKILVTSRSGNNFTLTSRAYDGSTAAAHSSGDTVEHILDATTVAEANKAAVNTIGKVTTAGDLLVGTGSEAMKRLAMGAANKAVGVNAGATDLTYLDTNASLLTSTGDIPYASAANTPARLPLGTARQALIVNAGATAPSWGDSLASLLTTQADIPYASAANTPARLAKGTANQALVMNAGATAPAWAASIQSLLTSTGDLLYASGANTPARLAVGTSSQVLGGGTTPGWVPGLAAAQWLETTTSETTSSTTFADLATVGPAVTVTVGASGRLLVWVGIDAYNNGAGNFSAASFALSGATTQAASDTYIVSGVSATTSSGSDLGSLFVLSGLTPGSTTVTLKYRVGAGTGTFTRRRVLAIPL